MAKKEVKIELVKPKLVETLIDIAHGSTFPFLMLQLTRSAKPTFISEVRVGPTLYDMLKNAYGTDRLVIYCDLRNGRIEAWTSDMLMSLRILKELGIMSDPKDWIAKSKEYIANVLSNRKSPIPKPSASNKDALEKTREILNAAKLLDEINSKESLLGVARDVLTSRTKDPDTAIYRLAMAIYHSKRLADESAVTKLEDLGEVYLALTGNGEFCKKYRHLIDELEKVPPSQRPEAVKTLMSFVIGAYLYNSALVNLGGT